MNDYAVCWHGACRHLQEVAGCICCCMVLDGGLPLWRFETGCCSHLTLCRCVSGLILLMDYKQLQPLEPAISWVLARPDTGCVVVWGQFWVHTGTAALLLPTWQGIEALLMQPRCSLAHHCRYACGSLMVRLTRCFDVVCRALKSDQHIVQHASAALSVPVQCSAATLFQ